MPKRRVVRFEFDIPLKKRLKGDSRKFPLTRLLARRARTNRDAASLQRLVDEHIAAGSGTTDLHFAPGKKRVRNEFFTVSPAIQNQALASARHDLAQLTLRKKRLAKALALRGRTQAAASATNPRARPAPSYLRPTSRPTPIHRLKIKRRK